MNRKQPRFLLVDDQEDLRGINACRLKMWYPDCVVEPLANGRALAEYTGSASVYITDYEMPEMNGLDALIARRKKGDYTPALLISGDIDLVHKRKNEIPLNTYTLSKLSPGTEFRQKLDEIIYKHSGVPAIPSRNL